MLPMARDRIVGWIDKSWAEDAGEEEGENEGEGSVGGAEDESDEAEMAV